MILNINKDINVLISLAAFKALLECFTLTDMPLSNITVLMEMVKSNNCSDEAYLFDQASN